MNAEAMATKLLYEEAACVDEQRWDDWLALFAPDCEYWAPCWREDHELCDDPASELSHVYYGSRAGLEDRVWRIRSRRSPASSPLPRTAHLVGNIRVVVEEPDSLEVRSTWTNHVYSLRQGDVTTLFGRYRHKLRREGENWRISAKKIELLNDYVQTYIDIYHL